MAELARALAALRIMGDDLVPSEVTDALGCAPTRGWARGDVWQSRGNTRTRAFGLWSVQADETAPADIDRQVAEILARTTTDLTVWDGLRARYDVEMFCGWFMERENERVLIQPETMLALATRGIALDVDLYGAYSDPVEDD